MREAQHHRFERERAAMVAEGGCGLVQQRGGGRLWTDQTGQEWLVGDLGRQAQATGGVEPAEAVEQIEGRLEW